MCTGAHYFNFHFSFDDDDVDFSCLFCISISSFGEVSVKFVGSFFNQVSCCLIAQF